jgi:hypothetical protein
MQNEYFLYTFLGVNDDVHPIEINLFVLYAVLTEGLLHRHTSKLNQY